MAVAQSAKPSSSDITVTLKRLIDLLEEDESDEYGILQPSQSAFKLAMLLVIEAYEVMGDSFPRASASIDEQGSIRLTWSKLESEYEVRLVCAANAEQPYLYLELGDTYALQRDINASILVQWLSLIHI